MTPTALGYEKFVADKCAEVGGLYAMNASVCAADYAAACVADAPSIAHHENCDALQLGPQLGPSTKPCNCGAAAQAAKGAK
jgi:hypothetical protein